MGEFKDKVIVITGGANGIGRCLVEEFVKLGSKVIFMDIDKVAGEKLVNMVGENATFFSGDVMIETDLQAFTSKVISIYKNVDVLINNACAGSGGILSNKSFDDFNAVLISKIAAPYELTKNLKAAFNPKASIINIASTRANQSQKDTESYTAANGGMVALTHALSVSLAPDVRVNAISPGWIDTSDYQLDAQKYVASSCDKMQHPVGRIGHPLDIFEMVKFLSSKSAGFITGQNFTVDGGMSKVMIYHGDEGWRYESEEKNND